jgi:ribosomal protein S12 methylthiotransferase accessory factor
MICREATLVNTPPDSSGIKLAPAPKIYSRELDKARPPAETVAWVRERFQEMGSQVLRETLRIDSGRLDIPVYMSRCGAAATALIGTAKQMGKGASPEQAEASALMELAERFSFFHFMRMTDFPLLTPRQARQVAGEAVMDFAHIAHSLHHPPQDLDRALAVYEELPLTWAWARNLSEDREEFIPLGWFYAINEYNGPAAGNCLEEAVLQGLCEVVERHVSALVTLEQRKTPGIAPDRLDDLVAMELVAKFRQSGVEVVLKDFTCDLGIPSVAALCWDPSTFPEKSEIVYTAGTATSPAKALIRTLTEVAQLAGDFESGSNYMVSALPKFSDLEQAAYVTRATDNRLLGDLPDVSRPDFNEEIQACLEALGRRGYTVYSLDVTHPGLAVPTVYTIIPGAHFAERTTDSDVIFHAAKLASQLDDPELGGRVLAAMGKAAGDGQGSYYFSFFQALALIEDEQPEEALAALDQALAQNPPARDLPSVLTQRGVALKDLGRYAEAAEVLERAAGFPEPHQEVFNLLGFCFYQQKQYEQAMEAFARAIEIEPGQGINYANIGSCLRELGRTMEACQMYRHALDLDPELDFARDNLRRLSQEG